MGTRAVLDADVWVAALLSPSGAAAAVLLSMEARQFQAVWSQPLLTEVQEALGDPRIRQKYRARLFEVQLLPEIVRRLGREVTIRGQTGLSDDPGDDKVVETAIRGKADFVVTFNTRHFAQGRALEHLTRHHITALPPAQFLETLRTFTAAHRRTRRRAIRLLSLRSRRRKPQR